VLYAGRSVQEADVTKIKKIILLNICGDRSTIGEISTHLLHWL